MSPPSPQIAGILIKSNFPFCQQLPLLSIDFLSGEQLEFGNRRRNKGTQKTHHLPDLGQQGHE